MEYVVDLQGFQKMPNIFVVKEVAILALNESTPPLVLLFEPPCKWSHLLEEERDVNRWLEFNFHGIPWKAGDIPYPQHIEVVQETLKDASKIYVKGLEKKKWLQRILPRVLISNMDDLGCLNLDMLNKDTHYTECNHHTLVWDPVCAAKNVHVLKKWIFDNWE